jgi:adenylate cyclase
MVTSGGFNWGHVPARRLEHREQAGKDAHMAQPGDDAFWRTIQSHRGRMVIRTMRVLPRSPRCAVCGAPYAGVGGRIVKPFGFAPSRKNPRLCVRCFEEIPDSGTEMDVGILFADIRGFTALSEHRSPHEVAGLLNPFYEAAIDVLCRHAIVDKLVGDEVMGLYLPRLFADDVGPHMVEDARDLLAAAGPLLDIGIGLDYGRAFVGNVGAREVKDFTAIGDVVNTAQRLQGVAGAGQAVISQRVCDVAGGVPADAVERTFELRGKGEPERAFVLG